MNIAISSPRLAPRLATLSELTRAFYTQEDSELRFGDSRTFGQYFRDNIRDFIHSNLKSAFNYNVASISSRANDKRRGHQLSQRIATIKRYPKDIEHAFLYVALIYQMTEDQAMKFEPSFMKARANIRSGEWQAITLQGVDRNIEGDHLAQFDRYNFIYHLHFSMSEPSLVAYYPSLDHMRKGREVRLRFGKFLSNIKDEIGIESEAIIKQYVDAYNSILQARNGWKLDFIGSNDRKGWLEIYQDTSHVQSCMSDCDSVKLYAHDISVLRLAYLADDDNEVIARTIVRDDRKEYIRIYPAPENSASGKWLQSLLRDQGYQWGSLEGALIKTYDHNDGGYSAPYIDRGNSSACQNADLENIDGKLYFRISENGEYNLTYTNGRTEEDDDEDEAYCEWCDEHYHDSDVHYYEYIGQSVCEGCSNEYGTHAISMHGDHEMMHIDDTVYCESDAERYDQDYIDHYDVIQCASSLDYYLLDDLVEIMPDVFIHNSLVIEPITPYIHKIEHDNAHPIINEYQFIDQDDARFLPNGEMIHYSQFDDMILKLNTFKLESEAIHG